ncbi:MAG: hypothetical protein ABIY55_20540 [Kofleriaceae bacterium]
MTSSSADRSPEPSSSEPRSSDPVAPGSRLPLGFGGASETDGTLPPNRIDIETTRGAARDMIDVVEPSHLVERDLELINFLVTKAIEQCTPAYPEPSIALPGARQRSAKHRR